MVRRRDALRATVGLLCLVVVTGDCVETYTTLPTDTTCTAGCSIGKYNPGIRQSAGKIRGYVTCPTDNTIPSRCNTYTQDNQGQYGQVSDGIGPPYGSFPDGRNAYYPSSNRQKWTITAKENNQVVAVNTWRFGFFFFETQNYDELTICYKEFSGPTTCPLVFSGRTNKANWYDEANAPVLSLADYSLQSKPAVTSTGQPWPDPKWYDLGPGIYASEITITFVSQPGFPNTDGYVDYQNTVSKRGGFDLLWGVIKEDCWCCVACPANTYKDTVSGAACSACPRGKTSGLGASTCTNCPVLTNTPNWNDADMGCSCNAGYEGISTSCTPCRAGTYKNDTVPTPANVACSGCSCQPSSNTYFGTISSNIQTYGHIYTYADNAQCSWVIGFSKSSPGHVLALSFTSFDLEYLYDTVSINEITSSGSLVSALATDLSGQGPGTSQTYTSNTGYMQLTFTSNWIIHHEGFAATWRIVQRTSTSCTACVAGTYTSAAGSALCTACAAGKYSKATGASTAAACVACPANSKTIPWNPADTCFCNAGYEGYGTSCTVCPAGKYKNNDLPTSAQVTCSGCSCLSTSNTYSGGISSAPSGQNFYAALANCLWVIGVSDPNATAVLTLSFSFFDLQRDYDFVSINEITSSGSVVKALATGLTGTGPGTSQKYTSNTGYMQVRFTSDETVTGYGFVAAWIIHTPCTACPAGTFSEKAGANLQCWPCPTDTFASVAGATQCLPCPQSQTSLAASSVCACGPGFYNGSL